MRQVPKIRTPTLRRYNKRQMRRRVNRVDRPILTERWLRR